MNKLNEWLEATKRVVKDNIVYLFTFLGMFSLSTLWVTVIFSIVVTIPMVLVLISTALFVADIVDYATSGKQKF